MPRAVGSIRKEMNLAPLFRGVRKLPTMRLLTFLSLVLLLGVCEAQCVEPAEVEIRGVVRDGRGGEPLARVAVSLEGTPFHAITDGEGRFDIKALKPGDYTLSVSTVGYKLALIKVNLANGQLKEFEVTLTPDNLRQTTTVEVSAGPFGAPRIDSPSEISLSGNDAKNLASVLADDPLRAVQALPGITSDDDFNSRFSLRGADYSRIGLYVDDVLLHQPFHMIEGASGTGSLTIVNGDMLDNIDVQSGVYPASYGDSTAAAVDLQTREGSQVKPSFRVTASASNSGGRFFALRHRGKPLHARNSPRRLSRMSIGRLHLGQFTPAALGSGRGGGWMCTSAGIWLVPLHWGYFVQPRKARRPFHFTAIGAPQSGQVPWTSSSFTSFSGAPTSSQGSVPRQSG